MSWYWTTGDLRNSPRPQRRDLLDILEDRHERRSTVVTSQLPIEHWHKMIGEPTHADAILDRLVHNAYRIALKGESMRKVNAKGGRSLKAHHNNPNRVATLRQGGNFAWIRRQLWLGTSGSFEMDQVATFSGIRTTNRNVRF